MFTPDNILEMMKEYNQLIDRCVEIKQTVQEWTNNWMESYDTSSVQPDELCTVFSENVWCLPDALEQNLTFIDKWCPKAIADSQAVIDSQFEEIKGESSEDDKC